MSELDLVLLTGVWTPIFDNMDLIRIREKKTKASHSNRIGHVEGNIMQTTIQKIEVKEREKTRFRKENKLFL
jgi:hypothetical protein